MRVVGLCPWLIVKIHIFTRMWYQFYGCLGSLWSLYLRDVSETRNCGVFLLILLYVWYSKPIEREDCFLVYWWWCLQSDVFQFSRFFCIECECAADRRKIVNRTQNVQERILNFIRNEEQIRKEFSSYGLN